ncbi:unnamed protein product [Sphagnum jensenii]|uniref:HMA domain-containing protein n=1 Tax=Sphagnum jensenii TaxID=128206 RepID=A0ABP1B4D0_9BRYO
MASIDEVMSHRNRDPKWMTDSIQTEEVLKKKHKDPTWMTGSNEKQTSQPQAPKASAIPQMNFKVHMCCATCEEKAKEEAGEVPGVVSVITDGRQGLVTVLGGADSAAVLKKLKRHVDKKATYWPAEVPVPKVAVVPNVSAGGMIVGKGERNSQIGEKGGMKGTGPGMGDPRMVQTMRPDPRMAETMRPDPRMVDPRMAETMRPDPRMVDPRMAETMRPDPRMVDPRMAETMRPDPRMVDPRMVDAREMRGGVMREMPPVDPREMRNAEVREGWVVDPRETRGGDMRERRPVDPREMRNAEVREGWVVDPREMRSGMREMRPADMRERRAAEMREMRPLDPRMVDPREVGGVHAREMQQPIDAREMYPVDPRTFDIRGGDPRDYRFSNLQRMHAPPPELYYNNRSQEADPRVFQPKESYFSDYRPSQSYPANYSNSASYYDEDDMSPYYMNQAVY